MQSPLSNSDLGRFQISLYFDDFVVLFSSHFPKITGIANLVASFFFYSTVLSHCGTPGPHFRGDRGGHNILPIVPQLCMENFYFLRIFNFIFNNISCLLRSPSHFLLFCYALKQFYTNFRKHCIEFGRFKQFAPLRTLLAMSLAWASQQGRAGGTAPLESQIDSKI